MPTPKPENISVLEFYETFGTRLQLKLVSPSEGLAKIIKEKSINRPALALTGYFKHFASKRLQLFGAGEMSYLRDLSPRKQEAVLTQICQKRIPCIVISRKLSPTPSMIKIAQKFKIPLFRTPMKSKDFSAEATVLLENFLAPRTKIHGTLMDVKGIGTLLRGKSGVGKSECALALVERGHSLVADDLVHVKCLNEKELMGTSSELGRGYMECRGLGIINIADIFGIRAVRLEKRIDFVVTFDEWQPGMDEERTGLDEKHFPILKQKVPHIEIAVRPGRDLARIVEVASMALALKTMGYDSANQFNDKLLNFINNK